MQRAAMQWVVIGVMLLALLAVPLSIPIAVLVWPWITDTNKPPTIERASAEQWSDDKAFKASIVTTEHVNAVVVAPDWNAYSVKINASPGFHPSKLSYMPDDGWYTMLSLEDDGLYENAIDLRWQSTRSLKITVKTETLQGVLTHKIHDLTVQISYQPRLASPAAVQ